MSTPRGMTLPGGRRAIAIRLEYLLDRLDLINLLAWTERDTAADDLPALTNAQVTAAIRSTLRHAGDETPGYWQDGLDDDTREPIEAWATRLVDRTYGPALGEAAP